MFLQLSFIIKATVGPSAKQIPGRWLFGLDDDLRGHISHMTPLSQSAEGWRFRNFPCPTATTTEANCKC